MQSVDEKAKFRCCRVGLSAAQLWMCLSNLSSLGIKHVCIGLPDFSRVWEPSVTASNAMTRQLECSSDLDLVL